MNKKIRIPINFIKKLKDLKDVKKIRDLYMLYNAILAGQAEGDENKVMQKIEKICKKHNWDKEEVYNIIFEGESYNEY